MKQPENDKVVQDSAANDQPMNDTAILQISPLEFPWQTADPFLFCVHHDDAYPKGNAHLGPAASLAGRNMGMDFEGIDGWRMYHGDVVPGFPRHPHRGFETVTIVRRGYIDHSDSLGATARFGGGDVQWMTAGRGIVHAEMFPLLNADAPNPVELFQIWLNLPAENKLVAPHFKMLWNREIPTTILRDAAGRETTVTTVAGRLGEHKDGKEARPPAPPAPPPQSWAANPDSEVVICTIRMAPGAMWTLPKTTAETAQETTPNRTLYFFQGEGLRVEGQEIPLGSAVRLRADTPVRLQNGSKESEMLLLQGRPIGEPVAQMGPFVMNTQAEIRQAFQDYQQTEFGGWPWQSDGPVHSREKGRHALHPDGWLDEPAREE